MTGNLHKPNIRRRCGNCAIDRTDQEAKKACIHCTRETKAIDNWRPNLDTCKQIVMSYFKQRKTVTAHEIAEHAGIPVEIVLGAMAKLVEGGVLKTETTVVIVE